MFLGEYNYTIDQKRRLAIPTKFRTDLGKKAIISKGLDNCLALHTTEGFEKEAQGVGNLPSSQNAARGYSRFKFSGATEVNFDALGRILIPDYLKEYAQIKKNVVVIGLYNRIEIWSEENWKLYKQTTEKDVENIAEKLKEFGV